MARRVDFSSASSSLTAGTAGSRLKRGTVGGSEGTCQSYVIMSLAVVPRTRLPELSTRGRSCLRGTKQQTLALQESYQAERARSFVLGSTSSSWIRPVAKGAILTVASCAAFLLWSSSVHSNPLSTKTSSISVKRLYSVRNSVSEEGCDAR